VADCTMRGPLPQHAAGKSPRRGRFQSDLTTAVSHHLTRVSSWDLEHIGFPPSRSRCAENRRSLLRHLISRLQLNRRLIAAAQFRSCGKGLEAT
jgi:hypothetical protein